MKVKLDVNNCYQINQTDDTHEWFLEFKTTQQIDRLIDELKDARNDAIAKRQKEFENKHQLSLNF